MLSKTENHKYGFDFIATTLKPQIVCISIGGFHPNMISSKSFEIFDMIITTQTHLIYLTYLTHDDLISVIPACQDPLLDLCPAISLPKFGNATKLYPLIWRFLPAIDPQVDIFFSRDLDSRISQREVAAVSQFLQSDVKVGVKAIND